MTEALSTSGRVTLLEALDRLLNKGVMINGDITISVADVDLIFVGLRVLLASVETADRLRWGIREREPVESLP
ncbi:MAG: gas vesicle protein [Nitrospinota bacterium]